MAQTAALQLPTPVSMLAEVVSGLQASQKELQPKYFYDTRGCELFEEICRLPEYYLTRTETAIMQAYSPAMAAQLGPDSVVIEIGCGNSLKTQLLLEQLRPSAFVPIDIAREQLDTSCSALAHLYPHMVVTPICADFSQPVTLPVAGLPPARRRILYFPGSTIGNFTLPQAQGFLERWAPLLGPGGGALIGVDLKKDPALLTAAYNDTQGVTAQFNLNILVRFNRELGANFDLGAFHHNAFFNDTYGRIEMHLASVRQQRVNIDGYEFTFRAGETIHTESSYKYSRPEFEKLAHDAGFTLATTWTDERNLFALHYLTLPS